MARGGGRLQPRAAAAPARGDRGPLGLLCLALLCALGAAEAEFSILDEAQVLASQMRKLATEELRVVTMQRIFNSFVYTEKISNGESEVQQLAKKIREKFNRYLDVVNRNKQVVEASYTAHLTSPLTAIQDCCTIPPSMMEFDGNFNTNVSRTISCDRLSTTVNSRAFNPGRDLNSGEQHSSTLGFFSFCCRVFFPLDSNISLAQRICIDCHSNKLLFLLASVTLNYYYYCPELKCFLLFIIFIIFPFPPHCSAQMSSGHSVAVMGIDFTLRYFYKVLMDLLPVCNQDGGNKIRCFIMEDRGYLVAHPTLIDPKGHAPVEQQHITHKEPLVANDILNHPNFVKKNLCNSFSDRTVQRFYKFNTSLVGDLTNLVHGSHCSKYRLTRIPGTNAFVGIVNETCDSLAFCACSMVDRLCLNCHRMEQNECECPCECPLEVNECTGNLTNAESRNPSCEVHQEPMTFTAIDPSLQDALPQCINTQCNQRTESGDCFGVLDCEWCMVDSDGKTHLDKSYCAPQKECFGGIVGAKSPYVDDLGAIGDEVITLNMIKSAPVGPVAGGIMGCIMVLVLAVYAYRHQIHRRSHQHMSPLAAQGELDSGTQQQAGDGKKKPISNTRFIAAVIERHAHSPERRRRYWGRSGTESDHGYSTMSPQEDSENPPCNNDPLSAGVDVGTHEEDLELDTPPQTAALLSHKFHHYRLHHPALHHSHHLQAAVTVHTVDAEC
uniref:VWFA domain-containing protein n=1 Tax=Taeniopygia guttata TaxID=59729 RepID=H0ZI67_TAEGU